MSPGFHRTVGRPGSSIAGASDRASVASSGGHASNVVGPDTTPQQYGVLGEKQLSIALRCVTMTVK